jgi:hypothetical protein
VTRYLPYSRRELRARFVTWVRRNWLLILGAAVGGAVLLAVETYLLMAIGDRTSWKWYLLGVTHSVVLLTFAHLLWATFMANDREAIHHVRGAWGEENTRNELRRAKRKKLIWGWIDSVTLQSGDIDHLVVTRAGGLVAIDSKWRNHLDAADRDAMVQSALKVRLRAEGVVQTLLQRERGGHRASSNPLAVRPAVVIWGAARDQIPSETRVEGVDFVGGQDFLSWLRRLDGEAVETDAAQDVLQRVAGFRATAWPTAPRR